jgi:hypothetical protein
MTLLRKWLRWLIPHDPQLDAARVRLDSDSAKMEKHARRMERSAEALEKRVDTNHISESIADLIRRAAR